MPEVLIALGGAWMIAGAATYLAFCAKSGPPPEDLAWLYTLFIFAAWPVALMILVTSDD